MIFLKRIVLLAIISITNSCFGQNIQFKKGEFQLAELLELNASDWNPYEDNFNKGFDNGIYWFKIKLATSDEPYILSIPESHISRARLYKSDGGAIAKMERTRFINFKIERLAVPTVFYLRVNCQLEARVPLVIQSQRSYYDSEFIDFSVIGIYWGIVFSVLFINLFSYFSFRNITYLLYMLMAFGMASNALYKDGLFALFFGRLGINEVIEPTINSIVPLVAIFFTNAYLQFSIHRPKLYRLAIGFFAVSFVLNVFLIINGPSILIFTLVDILILASLDTYWLIGLLLRKKSLEAKLFTVAYGLPLLFAHGYYLFPHLGMDLLGLNLYWYKIGSVFEMVIFTYAIMYQAKRLSNENKSIRLKIEQYAKQLIQKNEEITSERVMVNLIKTHGFTMKEIGILEELSSGIANKEIAKRHFISENTVKFHLKNIYQKLEVNNRKQASEVFKGFNLDE